MGLSTRQEGVVLLEGRGRWDAEDKEEEEDDEEVDGCEPLTVVVVEALVGVADVDTDVVAVDSLSLLL